MNPATTARQPSISPPHTMIIACEHRVVSELNNVAQRFTVDAREVHYFMEQWSRTSMIHDAQVHAALALRWLFNASKRFTTELPAYNF